MFNRLRIFFNIEYKEGKEYWIPTKNIIITSHFLQHYPVIEKLRTKMEIYEKTGTLCPIIINRNFELVDGYCSYLILKEYKLGKIPVYFDYSK